MAMIKCPECGSEISDKSERCIKCNYTLNNIAKKSDKPKKKKVLLIIAIIVIAVLIIFFILIQSVFLKANILMSDLEAGDTIKISNIVEPAYGFTILQDAESIVDTDVLGKISVPYTLRCFGLSKSREIEVEVIDTKNPIINGPDLLVITDISSIDWSNKYSVDDFSQNLAKKITSKGWIPSTEGVYDLLLTVKDKSGNVGKKQIEIEILKATKEEEVAIQFINKLVREIGYKIEDITKFRMFMADSNTYFAEINGSDTYMYDDKNSSLYTFEEAILLAGYYNQRSAYKIMLDVMLNNIDMTRINKLMQ